MNKKEKINAQQYGSLLGRTVYQIKPVIVDLEFNKKVEENKVRITKPIYRFVPEKIEVLELKVETCVDGTAKVRINNNADLRFPIECDVPVPTPEAIAAAIANFHAGDKTPMIFTPSEVLIRELKAMNNDSITVATTLASELLAQAESIKKGLDLDIKAIADEMDTYSTL